MFSIEKFSAQNSTKIYKLSYRSVVTSMFYIPSMRAIAEHLELINSK